ncbi:hypothetical protein H5P28_07250 [Ruficoccus amylovorans]|uniref:Uncharacterized protein n=1 Tax=Ruficoccus amylovorans TaxID=1804625 RepID=A0A842HEH5_9BACT|nr:hypothetical protein [Ruficoccus amylovorans]MBC2594056.1 hypothetical protein [Ruficoccus amylovorans]
MEWQFKPPARESSVSGETFSEGEIVVCILHLDAEGQLQRVDLREEEADAFSAPGGVLGRWRREVKTPNEEAREARRQLMATTEELFVSLFEESDPEGEQDRAVLKQLLALMLERKRVLRRVGPAVKGVQRYRHPKQDREYDVPMDDIDPAKLIRIQEQLQLLV